TDVTLRGGTNNRDDVVLVGKGMSNSTSGVVDSGVWTNGQRITVANLTIRDVFSYGVMLAPGAQAPHLYNLHLINAGQAFVEASAGGAGGGADNGVVEYTVAEYTGTALAASTTGVEVHAGKNWVVRHNLFRNLVAPAGSMAGPAVVLADGTSG